MADLWATLRTGLADRYRLERELGRGGMARFYLPHDLKHDRPRWTLSPPSSTRRRS